MTNKLQPVDLAKLVRPLEVETTFDKDPARQRLDRSRSCPVCWTPESEAATSDR